MSDVVIKAEDLGKKYVINHETKEPYHTFQDAMKNGAKSVVNTLNPFHSATSMQSEDFWALQDINFEIKRGDKVGIIGHNGAGKSTLLKLLSRITELTTGKIHINGRIASLLEVGTGFHPELTGRENIFLNGAILGMSRQEIKAKFDQIVAFSEVEKFLDTPVKRYSSGMYVRLAFSVAAHLEPEILVIDEVLAVGDAAFQKKCLGKMDDVSKEGRTVLFVSHNMNAIKQLCNKVILLENGRLSLISDNVHESIHSYFANSSHGYSSEWHNHLNDYNNEFFKPLSFKIVDKDGIVPSMPISSNKEYYIEIEAEIEKLDKALTVGYCVFTNDDQQLYWSYQTDTLEKEWPVLTKGKNILRSQFPSRLLNEGGYRIELIGGLHFVKWFFEPQKNNPSIRIEIQGGISDSPYMTHKRPTLLSPIIDWKQVHDK